MNAASNFGGRERRVFDLLKSRPNKVVSHLAVMEAMYGRQTAGEPDYRRIGFCVSNLKMLLKGTEYEGRISNIRKFGFILDMPEEKAVA